jgi:O-antigen ligase
MTRWPYGALSLLIGTSVMPRYFVEIFGWKARPEHFAAAIVFILASVWLLAGKRQLHLQKIDYCVLAYVGLNFVSSAFTSPEPASTLRWALLSTLAILPYFLIRFLVRDLATLRKVFRVFLIVALAESAYGILCYASHHAFGTTVGVEPGQYFLDVAAPYGSMYEANMLGAYSACCALLCLSLYLWNERYRVPYMFGFLLGLLGTILSFSRGALVALVASGAWIFWMTRRQRNVPSRKLIFLIPAVAIVLLLASASVRGVLQERISNLFSQGLAEETTLTRYIVIFESLQEFPNHALLGSGTASLQLTFDWAKYIPEWAGNPIWVGNVSVRILHDTGLFGLAAFLAFLVYLWRQIRTGLRTAIEVPMLIGLSAGALVYSITFQSTDGTTLAFSWVHLGLLATAGIILAGFNQESNRLAT